MHRQVFLVDLLLISLLTALLEWMSEYGLRTYRPTTPDSVVSYLNHAQIA